MRNQRYVYSEDFDESSELRFTWTQEEIARAIKGSTSEELRAEQFARAAEAESQGRICIVCDGPVFHGSRLGKSIKVFGDGGFHVHSLCVGVFEYGPLRPEIVLVLQKTEARDLAYGTW